MSTWTSVRPSPPPTHSSSMGSHPHQVPFRTPHSVPQPLSFGFGASAAGPAPSLVAMMKRPAGNASLGFGFGVAAVAPPASPTTNRRRRRSPSPPAANGGEEEAMSDDDHAGFPKAASASVRSVKRIRALPSTPLQNSSNPNKAPSSSSSSAAQANHADDVDVGKLLTNLSKQELLTVCTRLVTANPSLKPTILSLLPPPSFTTFSSSLTSLEAEVLKTLCGGGRAEYVWGRCRQALESYVLECRGWLSQFCPSGHAASASATEPEHLHPSTTFMFLETLTSSMRRVEACLPPLTSSTSLIVSSPSRNHNSNDSFSSHLIPITINAWHQLLTRLVSSHSSSGRVYSAETVRAWIRSLEGLVIPTPEEFGWTARHKETSQSSESGKEESVRGKMEGVRVRWVNELGWMGGYKPMPLPHHAQQQQSQQGLSPTNGSSVLAST